MLEAIRVLGRLLDDLEHVRVQNGNRIAALEREGYERLPHLVAVQEQVNRAEHLAELELKRAWRHHPLAPWAKAYHGLGEKSIARLIAEIGDPADRPNVAKLWAYCGHGDPARSGSIPKGATQEELFKRGNPRAKKQVWLISTNLLKAGNRDAYDAARLKYADAVHQAKCVRCGPAGQPALPGSPLSDGHKHARALRAAGKAFLRDLWLAGGAVHSANDLQGGNGGAAQNISESQLDDGGAAHSSHDPHSANGGAAQHDVDIHAVGGGAAQNSEGQATDDTQLRDALAAA